MKDNELIAALIPILKAGLDACGFSTVAIKQNFQPTPQGANRGSTVYLHKIGDKLHGSPRRSDEYDDEENSFVHTETQLYETTFQVTSLAIQSTSTTSETASDIGSAAIHSLQSDSAIASMQALGIGILRVTNLTNANWLDDYGRNEFAPSFDFTVLHHRARITATPAVETYEYRVNRV